MAFTLKRVRSSKAYPTFVSSLFAYQIALHANFETEIEGVLTLATDINVCSLTFIADDMWGLVLERRTVCFKKHEKRVSHHEAIEVMVALPATTNNIGDQLSHFHASQKVKN